MQRKSLLAVTLSVIALAFALAPSLAAAQPAKGYYRFPAIHGDTVIFTAEGDLWRVGVQGGVAQRLTTHLAPETNPAISPDGQWLAFTADYEGPSEAYVMPISGGMPTRLTWHGGTVIGWTPAGNVIYSTRGYSTLPNVQLVEVNPESLARKVIPLAQASNGAYDSSGRLFFVRHRFQGSHAKRYKGGTAQNLWRFDRAGREAIPLTSDYAGTSKDPVWWNGRVYFLSDRDGTMNLWSINADGKDLRQHTRHDGWDAQTASGSGGRIVYQLGADIHLYEIASGANRAIPITLASDFDQSRVRWVKNPFTYLTSANISPTGDRIALTARGQVFVAPAKQGRLVEVTRGAAVRYRSARFFPDGASLSALSDQTGEVEFWQLDARGVKPSQQLTDGGKILRFDGVPSPDGKWIAFSDKNQVLWLADVAKRTVKQIDVNEVGGIGNLSWSPDSRWLVYGFDVPNTFTLFRLYSLDDASRTAITTDRFDHFSPVWSPDGKWLAFLSNRNLVSLVPSPWGPYAPMPFFDQRAMIFLLPLQKGLRSPFQPADELQAEKKEEKKDDKEKKEVTVTIDRDGILERVIQVPVPPGNYSSLSITATHLYFTSTDISPRRETSLMAVKISNDDNQPQEIAPRIGSYQLSADRKKILLRRGNEMYVIDANGQRVQDLAKFRVDLSNWTFQVDPREDWRQLFSDAWRLHRDYFYDPGMHGVDWPAMRRKYEPLVSRVTDRAELNNLIAQLISELSALHANVRGGDMRDGLDDIGVASLGAAFERDSAAGGFRVARIYRNDPDFPSDRSPLLQPGVEVQEGDVITAVNGVEALSVPDLGELLRNQARRQVLLSIKEKATGTTRQAIAVPITGAAENTLRYSAWELERRKMVDDWGKGEIGYVHLRAMVNSSYTEWARNFFPVYDRKAIVVDVRHNGGGNIDSWILNSLLRRAWMWWKSRTGEVYPNMQYAYIGHLVVLMDEHTGSDGEAFAEGFRRLGLGKLIGTRTWGGEIWLSGSNTQKDRGVATAAESGVFAGNEWLIEGHGVDPDIVVDNLPHATFNGEDAQLRAAVEHLQKLLREKPVALPKPPPYPNKSLKKP
jgi:tricorn protease